MKRKPVFAAAVGAGLLALGIVGVTLTRTEAIVKGAALSKTLPFALSLIATLVGLVTVLYALLPKPKPLAVRTLTLAALFAALSYIGFAVCRIDIPVGGTKTAFHLGNVFCVLAALFLGGFWGGMSGAIGLTLADLTSAYVTSAPKTFVLKLGIGLIVGFVAHGIFHITREGNRKVPVSVATVLSCTAGMAFNMVADPVVGYFYKMYVLGVPQNAADIWAKMGAVTTAVNGVLAIVCASIFYLALRKPLKQTRLLPEL